MLSRICRIRRTAAYEPEVDARMLTGWALVLRVISRDIIEAVTNELGKESKRRNVTKCAARSMPVRKTAASNDGSMIFDHLRAEPGKVLRRETRRLLPLATRPRRAGTLSSLPSPPPAGSFLHRLRRRETIADPAMISSCGIGFRRTISRTSRPCGIFHMMAKPEVCFD